MAEDERKYEILPGVKLPDYKTLKEASSDFDESGVTDVEIRSMGYITDSNGVPDRATLEEIKRLQELGDEVAEREERASEESRKKMEAIMKSAVTKSASLDDLKQTAIRQASSEKLAEIEKRNQEEEARLAEEAEKKRIREERRALQRKQLEDARARAAAASETAAEAGAEAGDIDSEEEAEAKIEASPVASAAEAGAAVGIAAVEADEDVIDAPVVEEVVEAGADAGVIAEEEQEEQIVVETDPAAVTSEVVVDLTEPVMAKPATTEPDIAEPVVVEPEVDIDATGVISSVEETFEDFGEFLDDNKN